MKYTPEEYYMMMINSLSGISDDMHGNSAPEEAKRHVVRAIEICWTDFQSRFKNDNSLRGHNRGDSKVPEGSRTIGSGLPGHDSELED